MNFNLGELERLFDEIKEIINFIEISQFQNRRYRLYTSKVNNNINYSVPNDSIAHLLGINTNYLISTGVFKSTYSFDILKEMCQNAYRIYTLHNEGIINYDQLFSPFIYNKLKGFRKNIKINANEVEFICKYIPERAYINDTLTEKYDYIIVKKYQNGEIGILGLIKKQNNNYYTPMSNQLYDSFDDAKETLNKYLKNQEIIILTGINTFNSMSDYDKTVSLFTEEKEQKVKNALFYTDTFNCTLDVTNEVRFLIQNAKKNRTNYFEDNDLIDIIVTSIKEQKIIDVELFRNTNLSKIIESFNNYLCETQLNHNKHVEITYSDMKKELLALREIVKTYEEKNIELQNSVTCLENENKMLKTDNKEKEETIQKVLELVKPRN